jgi:hypothetical protein
MLPNAAAALEHANSKHGFHFATVKAKLSRRSCALVRLLPWLTRIVRAGLDYYSAMRLINYIRTAMQKGARCILAAAWL